MSHDPGPCPAERPSHPLVELDLPTPAELPGSCHAGRMSDEQWFYCFVHNTVEPREGCRASDRLGPYPDKATAARALEIAHERTAAQDKEDEEWTWGPAKD